MQHESNDTLDGLTNRKPPLVLFCQIAVRVCILTWLINLFVVISSSTKVPDAVHTVKWNHQDMLVYMTGWQHFILIWVWAIGLSLALLGHFVRIKSWWLTVRNRPRKGL